MADITISVPDNAVPSLVQALRHNFSNIDQGLPPAQFARAAIRSMLIREYVRYKRSLSSIELDNLVDQAVAAAEQEMNDIA